MSLYTDEWLIEIAGLLKAIDATDTTSNGLYLSGPIEVRDNDVSYGHLVNEDGIWGFRPYSDGPRDLHREITEANADGAAA